jgi:hypothetical protein
MAYYDVLFYEKLTYLTTLVDDESDRKLLETHSITKYILNDTAHSYSWELAE